MSLGYFAVDCKECNRYAVEILMSISQSDPTQLVNKFVKYPNKSFPSVPSFKPLNFKLSFRWVLS